MVATAMTALTGYVPGMAALVAEACERFDEMEELKLSSSAHFMGRMYRLFCISPFAYRITVAAFHGNTYYRPTVFSPSVPLHCSFSEQARSKAVTKQKAHKELGEAFDHIEHVFPELREQLCTLRQEVNHHEDPMSRGEAIGQSVGLVNAFDE